jgi:hypothetical protein
MISRRVTFCRAANAVLAVIGMASVLALLYLFYQYGWTGQRRFTSAAGIGWYFGVPAAVAAGCLAALRLRPTQKIAVAVIALAFITVVFGTEAILTGQGSDRASRLEKLQRVTPDGFVETRDADQVVADARRAGVNAVQFVGTPIPPRASTSATPAGAQLVPLGGFPQRPAVTCIDAGQWRTFESDEHGFHNPPGLWGRVDIAAVGNSWTHGFCVPSNENYVALVRRHYPATLNLGMASHGPLRILAVTTEYLSWLQPRIVLWFYFEGSLGELEYERKHPVLMRYLEEGFTQNLRDRKGEVEEVLNQYVDIQLAVDRENRARREAYETSSAPVLKALKLTSLREALGLVYGADGQEPASDLESSLIELLRRIITDVDNRVSSWGGTLVFVYLPARERFDGGDLGMGGRQRSHVLEMVRDKNIPLIDLLPAFAMHDDPLSLFPFRLHYHYNAAGHRLVADQVLRSQRIRTMAETRTNQSLQVKERGPG